MEKSKLHHFLFTVAMAFIMVYAMKCYNISLNIRGMTNAVFVMAFHELWIMWPIAIILELCFVERIAVNLAFIRLDKNTDSHRIQITISTMIVCLMCPIMSFIATLLFKDAGMEFIAVWLETTVLNFPMALAWQIFYGGAAIRQLEKMYIKHFATNKN